MAVAVSSSGLAALVLLLVTDAAVLIHAQCTGQNDPAACRLSVTSEMVFSLQPNNFISGSGNSIIMHYDLEDDPSENATVLPWLGGTDPFGLTAYDYTRPTGCLGVNGPLGYAGPLGSLGNLPNRFHGHTAEKRGHTWANNWCPIPVGQNDTSCVYGSFGPLGEAGPLNPIAYYYTMYHLGEGVNWSQDYNINLDSSGVWAVQGPLGPTGALGVLGALGPLGISLQPGMTTLATGVYKAPDVGVVRSTSPLRYTTDGSRWRQYDLYEFYSKAYAKKMQDNDCSFAVDSYLSDPEAGGDVFYFTSNYTHFVSVLVTPINLLDSFGLAVTSSLDGGNSYTNPICASESNPYSSEGGLINWCVYRANAGEMFAVNVTQLADGAPVTSGYYLYVTGSGFLEGPNATQLAAVDVWGPRQQLNGPPTFNINGSHQVWSPYAIST